MNDNAMEHMHGGSTGHMQGGTKGQSGTSSSAPCGASQVDSPPSCGVHNQMMVGVQTVYLSHLPMFMFEPERHEHNFQVILEVTLTGPGHAQETYTEDRRKNSQVRMYTMSPDPFEMIELDPERPTRTTLTGDVFRGHLERGGEVIIKRATAHVERIIYFHKFDADAQPLDQLEYILFGKAPDLFIAHVITRPPDFDQILGVKITEGKLPADDLRRGIHLRIPGRRNDLRTRVKAGERVAGQAAQPGGQNSQPIQLQLEAGTEFYFEEGELRAPPLSAADFAPTPEERRAGF
jgi:hypothetical protein